MSYTYRSDSALYSKPALNALGGARWEYKKIPIATTDLVTTQIIGAMILPAAHRLMDGWVESTVLDTNGTTAVTLTMGIMNHYYVEQPAGTPCFRVKSAVGSAASATANYNSNGVTDTTATPVLVSTLNLITTATVAQAGGRARLGVTTATTYTLTPTYTIGVDESWDRLIGIAFPTPPGTAAAGFIMIGMLFDRDQEINT